MLLSGLHKIATIHLLLIPLFKIMPRYWLITWEGSGCADIYLSKLRAAVANFSRWNGSHLFSEFSWLTRSFRDLENKLYALIMPMWNLPLGFCHADGIYVKKITNLYKQVKSQISFIIATQHKQYKLDSESD